MSATVIAEELAQNTARFNKRAAELSKKYLLLSWVRLAFFLASILITWQLAINYPWWTALLGGLLLTVFFFWMLKWHQRLAWQRDYHTERSRLSQEESARLSGMWKDLPDGGEDMQPDGHPYSADLDIFGRASLFKYLNRTCTPEGRSLLGEWLCAPAGPDEIGQRQVAVRWLANAAGWSQHFQATGRLWRRQAGTGAGELAALLPATHPLPAQWPGWVLPGMLVLAVAGSWAGWWPVEAAVGVYVLSIISALSLSARLQAIAETASKGSRHARLTAALARQVEQAEGWQNVPLLHQLQQQLHSPSASGAFQALDRILYRLENRSNLVYFLLVSAPFQAERHALHALHNWVARYAQQLPLWTKTIAEVEVLLSLAGMARLRPELPFPNIRSDERFYWSGQQVGHPLISQTERVDNDFQIGGQGHISLITGSNMAGKSTFLRTVGVNTVLALAGGPVCASALELTPMRVFTSMRTQDSLAESVSAFYAELLRLRGLLSYIAGSPVPVLFMLDELLKGTNSADRQKGIRGLMKQLAESHAAGLISTHDVEVARQHGLSEKQVSLYAFNCQMEKGTLLFDYRLSPGVCTSMNASALMEQMGIRVSD